MASILLASSGPMASTVLDPAAICVRPASATRQELSPAFEAILYNSKMSLCCAWRHTFFWPCCFQAFNRAGLAVSIAPHAPWAHWAPTRYDIRLVSWQQATRWRHTMHTYFPFAHFQRRIYNKNHFIFSIDSGGSGWWSLPFGLCRHAQTGENSQTIQGHLNGNILDRSRHGSYFRVFGMNFIRHLSWKNGFIRRSKHDMKSFQIYLERWKFGIQWMNGCMFLHIRIV